MSEPQNHTRDLDELNDEDVGATTTPGGESVFEPEAPEHPADDKSAAGPPGR